MSQDKLRLVSQQCHVHSQQQPHVRGSAESKPPVISYAVEDAALAQWLARKLAARGHPVWFDQMKLLGGE